MSIASIPALELLALRRHSEPIDEYEAARRREQERLDARFASRVERLARIRSLLNHPVSHCAGVTPCERRPPQGIDYDLAERHLERIYSFKSACMWRFQRDRKPDAEPFDTPSRIVEEIGLRLEQWRADGEVWRHRDYSPMGGRSVRWFIESDGTYLYPIDRGSEFYRKIRERALKFVRFIPSLLDLLPASDADAHVGLVDTQAIFTSIDVMARQACGGEPSSNEASGHSGPNSPSPSPDNVRDDYALELWNGGQYTHPQIFDLVNIAAKDRGWEPYESQGAYEKKVIRYADDYEKKRRLGKPGCPPKRPRK